MQGDAGTRVLCAASFPSATICLLGYFRLPEAPRALLQPSPAQGRAYRDCNHSSGLFVGDTASGEQSNTGVINDV